ncbi:MAG: hypothetical protein ACJAZM_000575 [Cyclobacteriaceae bacterium]|jgi:hypothetical protein
MKSKKKQSNHEADITKEDLLALGNKEQNLHSDDGDDAALVDRAEEVDFEGKDLDVPGRTLPENKKKKSLKDEENQLYSQGGEDNENLEQDSNPLPA